MKYLIIAILLMIYIFSYAFFQFDLRAKKLQRNREFNLCVLDLASCNKQGIYKHDNW